MRSTDTLAIVFGRLAYRQHRKEAALRAIGTMGKGLWQAGRMGLRRGLAGAGEAMMTGATKAAPKITPSVVGTGAKPFVTGGAQPMGVGARMGNWATGKMFDAGAGLQDLAKSKNMVGTIAGAGAKQLVNPFSFTSLSGANPLQNLPGLAGHAFNLPGATGQMQAAQKISEQAATQIPDMLSQVPWQQRLAYLMNPELLKGKLTPDMIMNMMQGGGAPAR